MYDDLNAAISNLHQENDSLRLIISDKTDTIDTLRSEIEHLNKVIENYQNNLKMIDINLYDAECSIKRAQEFAQDL